MVINSPDDSKKNIYSIPETAEILKTGILRMMPGSILQMRDKPTLGKYTYRKMDTNAPFSIEGTNFTGRIFPLSHVNPYKSSAILVSNAQQEGVLYLGDTGADRVEKAMHCKTFGKILHHW